MRSAEAASSDGSTTSKPHGVAAVTRQRVAVGAVTGLQAGQLRRRVAAQLVGEPDVCGLVDRQRKAGAERQLRGPAPGADDDTVVRGRPPAAADLARRSHGDHLVGDDAIAQRGGECPDRSGRADDAAVVVDHRRPAPRGEHRQSLGQLGRVDRAGAHAGVAEERVVALDRRAEQHGPVARDQLHAEVLLPVAPSRARLTRERDETRVVVRVAEDPGLAARLAVPWRAALIDGYRSAALDKRVRRRQADDSSSDHRDVHGPMNTRCARRPTSVRLRTDRTSIRSCSSSVSRRPGRTAAFT